MNAKCGARRGDAALAPFLHGRKTLGNMALTLDVDLPAGLFESAYAFGTLGRPGPHTPALLVLRGSCSASMTVVSASAALVCTNFGTDVGQ